MIALVPFKGPRDGKSRLSPVLTEEGRGRLAFWMMERVLRSLGASRRVERAFLISKDADARSVAEGLGVEAFEEESEGLNGALREAIAFVTGEAAGGAPRTVLVIPADLPLLSPEDVDAIGALCGGDASYVIASPSRRGEGTNALLLRPADVLTPAFGPDSFNRHRAEAEARGVAFRAYHSHRLGLDIDLPEDLDALRRALDPRAWAELSALLKVGAVVSP